MRIFHLATLADWDAAKRSGNYTTSTRGRTLAEEGFIHASRGDQWQGVRDRFYSDDEEPLVLLSIDTDLLSAPVVDEAVPDSEETFPHIYGPIPPAAVVQVIPLRDAPEPGTSFSALFLTEMFAQLLLASLVLATVVAGTLVGLTLPTDWGPISGAALGLVVGIVLARLVARRRRDRAIG